MANGPEPGMTPTAYEVHVYYAGPCGCAAATPDRPARGALALRCEHGNQWGWLTMCRLGPSDVVWCSPVLDGCTVEMSRSEPSP